MNKRNREGRTIQHSYSQYDYSTINFIQQIKGGREIITSKWLRRLWITSIVLSGLYYAGSYLLDKLFGDMCGNEVVQKLPSPNGEKVAYIFQRDCGATTGTSYQLSLLDSNEELPNKTGNTFVSDKLFQIKWISDDELQVNYKKSSETYEMNKSVDWTKIDYIRN